MSAPHGTDDDARARYRALLAIERRYDGPVPRRRQANPDTLRRRLAARRGALIEMLRADAPHGGRGSAAAIRGGQRARALGPEISQLATRSGVR